MLLTHLQKAVERVASARLGQTKTTSSPEKGLTLIECLVAIVVIAVAVSTITPALVISVATRVQSQKAEQALALAQGEIENIRLIIERGDYDVTNLPRSTPTTTYPTVTYSTPGNMDAPTSGSILASTTAYQDLPVTSLRSVDVDGDGSLDYALQIYRTEGQNSSAGIPVAFGLGVRIYDYDAASTASALEVEPARLGFTGGEGERGRKPLAALYTTVVKGDNINTYCDYHEYITPSASTPFGCD